MQIGKAARSNGSHIKSRLKMEPHGVFREVTALCTNKDHYQRLGTRLRMSFEDQKCIGIHPKCAEILITVTITQLPSFRTKL